jgi:3-oxoacyl-[acyl-carrier protein] reductase
MNKPLVDKVALVTGASRGIGRSVAIALAKENATVVAAARDMEMLQETCRIIEEAGGQALVSTVELSDENSIRELMETVTEKFGRLDVLINNAGITLSSSLEETTTDDWDRLMAVNVRGAFILCREAMGLLRQAQPGVIVNISSVVGVKGYAKQIAYTASKHAMRGMSIAMAEELKESNVRVHVICPGGVDTEMVSRVRPDINKDELIQPKEIAELVLYLVSHTGNAIVDEIRVRRATSGPWF